MDRKILEEKTQGLNVEMFLANDAENMDSVEYKDANGNQVRWHAADKIFYKIDKDGFWIPKKDSNGKYLEKRVRKHRWTKDAEYFDRMIPVLEKADSGVKSDNWFAEYIKMAVKQAETTDPVKGVDPEHCLEAFIAESLQFSWGVQTLRTQISVHKDKLKKKGVSDAELAKIPSLKAKMNKPRPTFTKAGVASYTEEQVNEIKDLLSGLD